MPLSAGGPLPGAQVKAAVLALLPLSACANAPSAQSSVVNPACLLLCWGQPRQERPPEARPASTIINVEPVLAPQRKR